MRRVSRAAVVAVLTAVAVGTPMLRAAAAPAAAGGFTSVTPARVLDTGSGLGTARAPLGGHHAASFQLTGLAGVPATGVSAVAVHVSVTAEQQSGALTLYGAGTTRPALPNLFFSASQASSNTAVVSPGSGGRGQIYNGSAGSVQVSVDVLGYFTAGGTAPGSFHPLGAERILDTHSGVGTAAHPLGAHRTLVLRVAGVHAVPAAANAVLLNLATSSPTRTGHLVVFPTSAPRPAVSSLSYAAGQHTGDLVSATVGRHGSVSIYNASSGTVDVTADLTGYFAGGTVLDAGMLVPRIPIHDYASRELSAGQGGGPIPARAGRKISLFSGFSLPQGAFTALVELTVPGPSTTGHLVAYRPGTARPAVSSLDFAAGNSATNLAVVRLDSAGELSVYNASPKPVDLAVDVLGFVDDGTLGAIAGSAVDAAANTPVSGVVENLGQAPYPEWNDPVAVTADDGSYSIAGLAPADYTVCFAGRHASDALAGYGFADTCYQDESSSADTVTVNAGQVTSGIEEHLPADAALSGHVTDGAGHPLQGVHVDIAGSDADLTATTASDGSYTITGYDGFLNGDRSPLCGAGGPGITGGSSPAGYLTSCSGWDGPSAPGEHITGVDVVMSAAAGVSGTVTDTGGHPVAGVPVSVVCCGGTRNTFPDATTDAHGRYLAKYIDPGLSYLVCFQGSAVKSGPANGYVDRCYKHVTVTSPNAPAGATRLTLTAGHITTGINETLPEAAAVSGTVKDAKGNPLAGVTVSLQGTDPVAVWTAKTNSAGTYRITRLAGGSYQVCANVSAGYQGGWSKYGYVSSCRSHALTLTTGTLTTGVNVTLVAAGALAGRVTDSAGTGLSGVDVQVSSALSGVTTKADGSYLVTGLRPGTRTVCFFPGSSPGGASPTGYQARCYRNQPYGGTPTGITVTTNQKSTANQALLAAGGISGTVTDTDGQPVGHVGVTVTGPTDGGTTSDDAGHYSVVGLTPGSYTVCFAPVNYLDPSGPGHLPQCYDDVPPAGTPTPVTVSGAASTTVDATLAIAGGIHGVVTDTSAHPLSDVEVAATGPLGVQDAVTSTDGSYSLIGMQPGTYNVCFGANFDTSGGSAPYGYVSNDCHDVVVGNGWSTFDEQLVANGEISGTVTDGSAGIPDVEVQVSGANLDGVLATTAADGTYTTTPLAPGSYTVCFHDISGQHSDRCYQDVVPPATGTPVVVTEATVTTGIDQVLPTASAFRRAR